MSTSNSRALLIGAAAASSGGGAPGEPITIERSLRFNSADSAYLNRTPASAGNRRKWTWASWVKRSVLDGSNFDTFFAYYQDPNNFTTIGTYRDVVDDIGIIDKSGGTTNLRVTTNAVFRDVSAWFHVVVAVDTDATTPSDRAKIYINGVLQTSLNSSNYGSGSTDTWINSTNQHYIGFNGGYYSNGYLAEVHFIDGQALDATIFGEFDATTGIWGPISYTGSYGTNGFHLDFADNSSAAALGYDAAGSNDWTVNNITAAEYRVIDAPTLSNGAMIVRGVGGGSVTVTISGTGNKNYFTSSDGIDWTWQSSATSATYTANYVASGGSGTTTRTAVSSGAFQYAMWNTNTNFDSSSNTTTDTTGLTFTTTTANGANGDSLRDSPTNGNTANDTGAGGQVPGNYATMNPLFLPDSHTFTQGNLTATTSTGAHQAICATFAMSSGKWYWEYVWDSGPSGNLTGIWRSDIFTADAYMGSPTGSYGYYSANGYKYAGGADSSYGASFTTGDVIGVAFDADAGSLTFYKNGVSQGTAFSGIPVGSGQSYYPAWSKDTAGTNTTTASLNFGQRPFAYQNVGVNRPSADFKPLCTAFLDDPTIADGSAYMDVVTYTGTGVTKSITDLEFSPDLVWIKQRSHAGGHYLYDVIRGANKPLYSHSTAQEGSASNQLMSFDSNGFTVEASDVNTLNRTHVAWTWDGGSSTVSNTNGSITSSVRANASAGFSIVSFNSGSTNGNKTIGHGLGVAPSLIILKSRTSVESWSVYHSAVCDTVNKWLLLNATDQLFDLSAIWGAALPTSTVFGIQTGYTTATNNDMIAYCFAPVEGYSAFGKYTSNQSNDGPFIYTGFRPRWILVKAAIRTFGSNWSIIDAARNPGNFSVSVSGTNILYASTAGTEFSSGGAQLDILSNGFKARSNSSDINDNGTYVYAAFAENPFKIARAR